MYFGSENMRYFTVFMLLIVMLSGCQQQNDEQYQGLGTNSEQDQMNVEETEMQDEINEDDYINRQVNEKIDSPEDEVNDDVEIDSVEDELENEELEESEQLEELDENDMEDGETDFVSIPFDRNDFLGRWNAVSDQYTFEGHISSLNDTQNKDGDFYSADLNHSLLMIHKSSPDEVYKYEIIGKGNSKHDRYAMITSWWQLFMVINPDLEAHEIDMIFNDLNIGANADLTKISTGPLSYLNQQYKITPTDNSYTLTLTFKGEQ